MSRPGRSSRPAPTTSRSTSQSTPRSASSREHVVRPEVVRVGARVGVRGSHRIVERRGKVVGRYGGEYYVAVDVRFPEGEERLFWPGISKKSRHHLLLGGVLC